VNEAITFKAALAISLPSHRLTYPSLG